MRSVEPDRLALDLLPEKFLRWFAGRGWSPREHQLDLLRKARDEVSALLIAPTGAGKTLAGFLPTLVELSSPLPPLCPPKPLGEGGRNGGEGSGVGGASANSLAEAFAESPPTPDPSPPRATRAGGGEMKSRGLHTLYISPLKALAVDIARNLEAPVAEMALPVRIETRTGDTPVSRRRGSGATRRISC